MVISSTPMTLSKHFSNALIELCPTVEGVTKQTVSKDFSGLDPSTSKRDFKVVRAPARYESEVKSVTTAKEGAGVSE